MAKKYLLYIHDDEWFDTIKNKSELINRLIAEHKNLPPFREKKISELGAWTPPTAPILVEPPAPINKPKKDYSVCKHGFPKGFCKKGCK